MTVAGDPAKTRNLGNIYVRLKPIEERDARSVRRDGRHPRARSCRRSRRTCGPRCSRSRTSAAAAAQNADVQFVINGPDLAEARALQPAARRRACKTLPGVVDVDTSLNAGKPELSVQRRPAEGGRPRRPGRRRRRGAAAARRRRSGDDLQRGRRAVRGAPARASGRTAAPKRRSAALTVPSSRLGSVALDNVANFTPGVGAVRHQPARRGSGR